MIVNVSRKGGLFRQLWKRLLLAMLVVTALVGGIAFWFYQLAVDRAAHREADEAVAFYTNRIAELEEEWRAGAARFKTRLEYLRILEDRQLRWIKLNSYLTAQSSDSTFDHLLILAADGHPLYRFGFAGELEKHPDSVHFHDGWHFRASDKRLFRVHVQPIWLGLEGNARLVLFRPVDNALLNQFAVHRTHLFLLWQGKTVASSLGDHGVGMERLDHHGEVRHDGSQYEQRQLTWRILGPAAPGPVPPPPGEHPPGHGLGHQGHGDHPPPPPPPPVGEREPESGPQLVLHRPVLQLFSQNELLAGSLMLLIALLASLWLATGSWAIRSGARVAALGRAAHGFGSSYLITPEVARELIDASQGLHDEISDAAVSLEHLAGMVAEHDRELRASEARLREITDVLGDGVYVLDQEGRVTFMNPEAQRLLGWNESEILGKNGHETFHFRTPDGMPLSVEECPVHRTIHTGKTYRSTNDWLIRREGSVLPVTIVSSPIQRDGEVIGSVAAFHDITPQLDNERKLRQASRYARSLIEASLDPLVTISEAGKISDVNGAFEEVTGAPRQELIGADFANWFTDPQSAGEGYRAVLAQGTVKDYPLTIRHRDGKTTDVLFNATVFRNEEGEIQGVFAAARDITERKRAEAELKQLNETLEQRVSSEVAKNLENERVLVQQSRLAAIGEMIGNIAHQWRQPINALALLLANIKDAQEFGELDEAYMEKAMYTGQSIIQRMSTTIDDFRNFFKPNKEKALFQVNEALHDALNILDAALRNSNIKLSLAGEETLSAWGYRNEFSQALLNLVANAKDVLVERKVRGAWIRITLSRVGNLARVEVEDNGGGIPETILEKIFDPYFTTKEKGTGIGLYMTRMIVENNMHGAIHAENCNEGARFCVDVPSEAS